MNNAILIHSILKLDKFNINLDIYLLFYCKLYIQLFSGYYSYQKVDLF